MHDLSLEYWITKSNNVTTYYSEVYNIKQKYKTVWNKTNTYSVPGVYNWQTLIERYINWFHCYLSCLMHQILKRNNRINSQSFWYEKMRIPVLHVRNYLLLAHFYVSGAKGFDCKRPIGFPRALWDCETPRK